MGADTIAGMATRRQLLASAVSGTAFAVSALALKGRATTTRVVRELRPVADQTTGAALLRLPPGFSYKSASWSLDATDDGNVVSGLHDGMGAFPAADGRTVTLVRNHEITLAPLLADRPVYDPTCGGGTTTLTFDAVAGDWLSSRVSLAGTYKNCSGGPTPWGSWLTCEETLADPSTHRVSRRHGFVFEVPAEGVGDPRPIPGLGRFEHEAAAVDPGTGIVYLTEDERRAGLYRFVPAAGSMGPGSLRGPGQLQMLAIDGRSDPKDRPGTAAPVKWVDIDDPEALDGRAVFAQGKARGGKTFRRLEGCWFDGGRLYFVSTTGGAAGKGQVWELGVANDRLTLLYESPGRDTLDMPDNLVSLPGLGLLLCEDGGSPTRLRLLTNDGEIVTVAENAVVLDGLRGFNGDYRGGEWCGACRAGDWLFVNLQVPGITFAITGPWETLAG
ncbi:MAG: DUF839 domain-containing protein [Gammaproteobacteria bacterium]|nr:DUF839 domain-containing protein [Gammaproteobacteria bacterium]